MTEPKPRAFHPSERVVERVMGRRTTETDAEFVEEFTIRRPRVEPAIVEDAAPRRPTYVRAPTLSPEAMARRRKAKKQERRSRQRNRR